MSNPSLQDAISAFGQSVTAKLSNPAISGAPEDQLRGPLETLVEQIAQICGKSPDAIGLVGETNLGEARLRPDYGVTDKNALIGFIEVKAPGKGADPRKFPTGHDKDQWQKLKSLPNLLYTDGNAFSLWRDGELQGKVIALGGNVESDGAKLSAPSELVGLFTDFFSWSPIPPKTPRQLAEISARLCRLLRDEVTEQLADKNPSLTGLAEDWRRLLFPQADDAAFADGYAQAVTFGLLIARTRDIALDEGIDHAASELRKSNSLIGTALSLLTDDPENTHQLRTSIGTMTRVLNEVNWAQVSKQDSDAWLYFYEHFLEVYDNALRKRTGSYYTPPEVVTAMVRLVDEVLQGPLFNRPAGLASSDVTVADPAVGTGTFLLGVLRRIAETVSKDQGPGGVPGAIAAAASRLIGFELQFGPFAVAQLRLIAEFQELMTPEGAPPATIPDLRLFVTDTLGNPFIEQEDWIPQAMKSIAQSRRDANKIKRDEQITVVIGNPPYKNQAAGQGGWIEEGGRGRQAPMDRWKPPAEWGIGAHTHHLKNLYIFFWRWATWKVFGSGLHDSSGMEDKDEEGIVCFITVSGFLNGPGFQKMRADLRASCSDIWVIDCSPEGQQPGVATRIFQGVQQPVCITIAARKKGKDQSQPGRVRYISLTKGRREGKFAELEKLSFSDDAWQDCPSEWRESFFPKASGQWAELPRLSSVFDFAALGSMPGRTWVMSPDKRTLGERWRRLIHERNPELKETLFHPHPNGDRTSTKRIASKLAGQELRSMAVSEDSASEVPPVGYSIRSLDRQWILPDARLLNRASPKLWDCNGNRQVYMTGLERTSPKNGPGITFTSLIPDHDHYNGKGGRVFPLWANAEASKSNFNPDLLALVSDTLNRTVSPEDMMAYLAGAMAHPAFTARFADDLVQPGLRVPLTADPDLFARAVALGREVVWLHCYGERFDDAEAGRPKGPPRMADGTRPTIPMDGAIPGAPEPLPDTMDYDAAEQRLHVGKGHVDNVPPAVWAYEVSGKNVLRQWFSYRRRDRSRPIIGDRRPPSPLDSIQPDHWLSEYTTDLINLLNVLGRLVALEPAQSALLDEILDHPLITVADLEAQSDNGADS